MFGIILSIPAFWKYAKYTLKHKIAAYVWLPDTDLCGLRSVQTLLLGKDRHDLGIEIRHQDLQRLVGLFGLGQGQHPAPCRQGVQRVQIPAIFIDGSQAVRRSVGEESVQKGHLEPSGVLC